MEQNATPVILKPVFTNFKTLQNRVLEHAVVAPDPSRLFSAAELVEQGVEFIPTLVDPILQKVGLACLAGSSDTGKSTLLRQLAIAIATGSDDFLGFAINATHRRAIYVSTEDDRNALSYLLGLQTKNYTTEQIENLYLLFDFEDLETRLEEELAKQPVDIVIIDCYADSYGGDLKDTQGNRTFLNEFQRLADKYQCLFLFLHHTGKRTENLEPNKNNLLSGQGFEGKMRVVIELRTDPLDPFKRHLCIVKGNYLPAHMKQESFVLTFHGPQTPFENTGERVAFENLAKSAESDEGKARFEQAVELKNEGLSYSEIAKKMGLGNKSSVASIFDRAKTKGWMN